MDSLLPPSADADIDTDILFAQTFVDQARLADNIRAVVPERSSALLADILAWYPIEQGAAEIVGYLALPDDDLEIEMDETGETLVDIAGADHQVRRVRLPRVTVRRR